jgi:DNA-directed RNA polymerase specialized sigma24 family protein
MVVVSDKGMVHMKGTGSPEPEAPSRRKFLGLRIDLLQCVQGLPANVREVFDLLVTQELSQQESAEVLGVSLSTVKSRWRAARLKLAEILHGWGWTGPGSEPTPEQLREYFNLPEDGT